MSDIDTMQMLCFATVNPEDGTQTLVVTVGPLSARESFALAMPVHEAVDEALHKVLTELGIKIVREGPIRTDNPDFNRETKQ